MMFSEQTLQEIKQRLRPSDVVGRKVTLQHKGHAEYSGLCPFHKEKTPSFTVSDQKGFYHCFGCQAHGDIFKFVMDTEGLNFQEAVEQLAKEAGVEFARAERVVQAQKQKQDEQEPLLALMEEACRFFQEQLRRPIGKAALDYLQKRGFDEAIIKQFRLGFVPDQWHQLQHYLKQKNYTDQQMLQVGLLSRNEKGETYDRFRGRVMFPILDLNSKVIAFGGRIIGPGEPKYLNSPETELFKKGNLLYNYASAKKLAYELGQVLVTEGYADTIALHKAGFANTVASLGTAITTHQVQLLWRLSKEPVMCLDGDMAGMKAMEKVAHVALPILKPGYTMKFVRLPVGYDPDDVVKKLGASHMKMLIDQAISLSDMLWQSEERKQDVSIPEHKAELEKRIAILVEQIEDKAVAGHYRNFFRQKIWHIGSQKKETRMSGWHLVSEMISANSVKGCEKLLMLAIFMYPQLLKDQNLYEEWVNIEFSSDELDTLRMIILQVADSGGQLSPENIEKMVDQAGHNHDIVYFNALKNRGLIPICTNNSEATEYFRYLLSRYCLAVLREEYDEMLRQMTEEAFLRAGSLKEQMDQLELSIKKVELAFGEVK